MALVKEIDPVANEPYCELPLTQGFSCKVDPDRFAELSRYKWSVRKAFSRHYAIRKFRKAGKQIFVHMHRFIAQTPPGEIPHHINHDTLDNRRANLLNMSEFDHIKRYSWR